LIHLASNENPLGCSPKALAAMQAALRQCNRYPDDNAGELQSKLAEHHRLRPEQVLVGAGSTELISIIARTLLRPGLEAVTSERSFIAYAIATRAAGGRLRQAPMRDQGFDLDAVAAAIDSSTPIVFLANPNNPTGTVFDAGATDKFLAQIPEHVTVVLDEAYYEYAEYFAAERGIPYSHSLDYVRERGNVVVLRTFSKVHGLAGARIGYALGPPPLLARFTEMRSTYSISLPAQAGALAALEDEIHIRQSVINNAAGAKWLAQALSKLGFHPVPTWANFLYCDIAEDAEAFSSRMRTEGVFIRPLARWGAANAVRVTIGTSEQNEAFLAAFKGVM
jgi:histidinol-phosphate aminotransferase